MRQLIDITGQKFAKLTVIERAGSDKWGCALWKCQCECGNLTIVRGSKLRRVKQSPADIVIFRI